MALRSLEQEFRAFQDKSPTNFVKQILGFCATPLATRHLFTPDIPTRYTYLAFITYAMAVVHTMGHMLSALHRDQNRYH